MLTTFHYICILFQVERMNNYIIYLDTALDLVAFVFGSFLICTFKGNRLKLTFGICSAMVGVVFILANIHYLNTDPSVRSKEIYELLVIDRMVKWLVLTSVTVMIPLASLRPGFITTLRLVLFAIPVLFIITIAGCYYLFNGQITPLTTLHSIAENAHRTDVRLRIFIFVAINLICWGYYILSLVGNNARSKRKGTLLMWIYTGGSVCILVYFVLFSLFINPVIFYAYDVFVSSFFIFFCVGFLLYENPFSRIKSKQEKAQDEKTTGQLPVWLQSHTERIYRDMEKLAEADKSFTQAQYAVNDLAGKLNVTPRLAVEAIKAAGFTGFKEYVIYLRIEHFKELVQRQNGKSVKELMYLSGFTTRSNFYRIFQRYEHMTPLEYMKQFC